MQHHAIVLEGPRREALARAMEYAEVLIGAPVTGHMDVWVLDVERFGKDEADALKTRAMQTPMGTTQVFVLAFDSATHEVQNGLLKLIEEPTDGTHFLFAVPTLDVLLPTVQSRLFYGGRVSGDIPERAFALMFLGATAVQRINLLEPYIKKEDKDRRIVRALLDALEVELHQRLLLHDQRAAAQLNEVLLTRGYCSDRSSSSKMLLEHLALAL